MSNKDRTDHMANERTFLAWIRTAIGIMALGFVVEKFNLFVKQISLIVPPFGRKVPTSPFAHYAGIILILLGTFIAVLAYIRFRIVARQINNDSYKPYFLLDLILTLFVLAAGVIMAIFMVG
jgi:putative membrane protein